MVVTELFKETIWFLGLHDDWYLLRIFYVHCDGQSAIQLAKNQVYHSRMKHIDV